MVEDIAHTKNARSSENIYINQQDAQISVIELYFHIRCSTCFGIC